MTGFLHTEMDVPVKLHIAFGSSKDNVGGVGPVTKLQAAKTEKYLDFRQEQNVFLFRKDSRVIRERIQTHIWLVKRLFPQSGWEMFYCRILERMGLYLHFLLCLNDCT
jgi:hypothetical protein